MSARRVRYTAPAPAVFRSREGDEIRVVSLTLEVAGSTAAVGDIGGAVVSEEEQQRLEGEDRPLTPQQQRAADVESVWATYVECMEPRRTELDPEGRRLILDALKVATAEECSNAIRGCKASPFHMGDNDRRKRYNRLSQILKGKRGGKTTREQIDMFLEIAARAGVQSDGTSADPAIVSQRKREVLDAFEFPGDDGAVRRGEESERWLVEHGWVVERDDEAGRPTFRRAL